MPTGPGVMFAAVYASMLLYAAALGCMLLGRRLGTARVAWTAGCALLWVHVALAMHLVHRWDHADLVRRTAEQSAAVTGVRAGAGVYVNYAFMLAWAADVAYWWAVGHERYRRRSRAATFVLHAFLLFIAFNGTVVFASAATRRVAIAAFAGLAVVAVVAAYVRRTASPGNADAAPTPQL